MDFREALQDLRKGLVRFGRFRRRWSVLQGFGRFAVLAPGVLLLWLLCDWAIGIPEWPLLISLGLIATFWLVTLVAWVVPPLLRGVRPEREALNVERLHGDLDNRLIGSLQLGREIAEAAERARGQDEESSLGYAPGLVRELIRRSAAEFRELDVRGLLNVRSARLWLRCGAVVVALWGLILVVAPGALRARADNVRYAWATVLDALFPVQLEVSPGDVRLVRGEPVDLDLIVHGARRRDVRLLQTTESEDGTTEEQVRHLTLDGGRVRYHEEAVEQSFRYRFAYGRKESEEYRVLVADLPRLEAINYELVYPAYTGQPPRTLVGRVPRLRALSGTSVLVSFAATTELNRDLCYVEWQDGSRQPVSINGRFGHFSFALTEPDRATIHLYGVYGRKFKMKRPISFEVTVQKDKPPVVQVLLRKKDLTILAEEARAFSFRWLAEDDFGVSEVTMEYHVEGVDELLGRPVREGEVSHRIEPPRDRVRDIFQKPLEGLTPPLAPGDRVTIRLHARDNNTETGPSVGRAQPLEIVVVRPDLGQFVEKEYGFGQRSVLGEIRKIKRSTNLLVDPKKTVRTEETFDIRRKKLKSRVSQESWPSGSEDAVGDYFRLLSGEQQ
jgi:hypothetical protein